MTIDTKIYLAQVEGVTPYSQSKHHSTPPLDKESPENYDIRTWREKMHVDENGEVFIPPMAFKIALGEAAKYLSIRIPGRGQSTFSKHFEAGVMILDKVPLGIKASDIKCDTLFVPADGQRGGGKRVTRRFPRVDDWRASFKIYVLDQTVTEDILLEHLTAVGHYIGIGRFRPRNNGYYGRFNISSFQEVSP